MAIKSLTKIHATFWDQSNLEKIVPHKNIMAYTLSSFKKKIPKILSMYLNLLKRKLVKNAEKYIELFLHNSQI